MDTLVIGEKYSHHETLGKLTIRKTGDTFPLGLLLTVAGISLAGLAVLIFQCVHSKAVTERDSETEDSEH